MEKIKVSVIVPVYKVEKYLDKCLDSIVNQTLKEMEIIVINDGSPDNSQEIIDKYKEKYEDIIVSKKIENAGVANARNEGLKLAKGEYIGFVDGDDYIELDMYENLYNKAISDCADMVISGHYLTRERGSVKTKKGALGNIEKYPNSIKEDPSLFLDSNPLITTKLFKRTLINGNDIEFQEYRVFEDLLFTYQCYLYADRITKVDECFYHYMRRESASVTGTFTTKYYDIFDVAKELRKFYLERGRGDLIEYVDFVIIKHIYLRFTSRVRVSEVKVKHKFIDDALAFLDAFIPNWKNNVYFRVNESAPKTKSRIIIYPYLRKVKQILSKKQ